MAFTVAMALQMEIFSKCKVLTGKSGLYNEIKWVNILEILDDLRHIESGEFLITTAHNLNTQSEKEQKNMIELFAARKLAAVAIQTGHYLQEIPLSFIRFSRDSNIPLIEIPAEVSFKTITRALMNELIWEQSPITEEHKGLVGSDRDKMISTMKSLWNRLQEEGLVEEVIINLKRFNIDPDDSLMVLAIAINKTEAKTPEHRQKPFFNFYGLVEQALTNFLLQQGLTFLIGPSESSVLLIVQSEDFRTGKENAEEAFAGWLIEYLNITFPGWRFMIGTSKVHKNIKGLPQVRSEAEKALQAARLGLPDRVDLVTYKKMGLYRLLIDFRKLDTLKNIYAETTKPLIAYDSKSRGSLVETLKTYLEHCSIKKSAETLFIHRHTMKYRLEQIEKLTGLDPQIPYDAFQLNLGLHIYQYLLAIRSTDTAP